MDLSIPVQTLRQVGRVAQAGLVEREGLVEAILLAAVAQEHVLVIGPPGTAKSEAVRRVSRALGGRCFEYLLGRFTEPNEIFGPVDLRKLREGLVETETRGMLPEAELAFLDEVFLGSTAILNTLLGVLNERTFRRGHTDVRVPLRVCVGASNALPDDPSLAAFADRFLVRVFVEPVADALLETLLEQGWGVGRAMEVVPGAMAAMDELAVAARAVDLGPARALLADAVRTLRQAGVVLPDRRIVRMQTLVAAAAVLDGRTAAGDGDLWPIILAVPTAEGQATAREALAKLLERTHNTSLPTAALEASGGSLARAQRLVDVGELLLAAHPPDTRRLEALGREIDASFGVDHRPAALTALRERLVEALRT